MNILILNLMPNKVDTEIQFKNVLERNKYISNQEINIDFMYMKSHKFKSIDLNYLKANYKDFEMIKKIKYDGLIITGAPLEFLDFNSVDYFEELKALINYSKSNFLSTIYICWGAQAGLYINYDLEKELYEEKIYEVINNNISKDRFFNNFLYKDLCEINIPHSRYSGLNFYSIMKKGLEISLISKNRVLSIIESKDKLYNSNKEYISKEIYIFGHLEYEAERLYLEYKRDIKNGIDISIPKKYFKRDFPKREILEYDTQLVKELIDYSWQDHALKFYANWINALSSLK